MYASRSGSAADYQAYLATYKNTVLDKFTDGRGGELPQGAVYTFRDLVTEIRDREGPGLTPDPAAFREIDGTVVISGRLFMTGRTPSGNELRNEWVFRAFEPADTVVADGSRRYTYMKLTESGGKLRLVRAAVPAGMKVTRDEAAGEGSPKVERISGRDNDGDHSDGSTIPVGRDMLAVMPMSEAARAAVLEGLADPGTTAERAADLLRTAEMAHASEMFILRSARRLTDDPNTEPVAANPFPEEAMSDPSVVSAAKTYDVTDAGSLAAWSKSNMATAESRGVIVASKAAVIAARQAGLRSPVVELAPGVRVGGNWDLPDGEFRSTLNALEAIANSTFDDIKVQIAGRAGFLPEILDLYSAAAASAGIKSRAEYVEFHKAFRGWMSGRTGAAILQVASLVRRPTGGNGGYSSAARLERARKELRDQAKLETRLGLTYMTLDFRHRPLVEGALLVGGEEAALVLARALSVVEDLQAVKRVMDYAKAKASRPADVLRMDETVRRVGSVLDATDPGLGTVVPFGAGRALVERALVAYKSKAEACRSAFRGAAELSPWVLALGTADGRRVTPGMA